MRRRKREMCNRNCPRCEDSIWIQRAIDFINNNQQTTDSRIQYQIATLRYLIGNQCFGYCCGVDINTLMQQVNFQGTRQTFQHNVLIPLKNEGIIAILVYPPRNCEPVFIPCSCEDVALVIEQYVNRIVSEIENNIMPFISLLHNA